MRSHRLSPATVLSVLALAIAAAFGWAAFPGSASVAYAQSELPVILGSNLGSSSGGAGEGCAASCLLVQSALTGAAVTAPSNGTITQWSVRDTSGTVSLWVLHQTAGELEVLASSSSVTLNGSDAVSTFPTNLAINAGDYIGLSVNAGGNAGAVANAGGSIWWFEPLPKALHPPGAGGPGTELLFDATELPSPPPTTPTAPTPASPSPALSPSTPAPAAPALVFSGATITGGNITLTQSGTAKVRVSCPADAVVRCAGKVSLTTAAAIISRARSGRKARQLQLGQASFSIPAGRTSTVSVRLTSKGAALVAQKSKLAVRATASSTDSTGQSNTATTLLTLRAAHTARRKK